MDLGALGTIVKGAVAVAAATSVAACVLQERLIFFPQPLDEAQRRGLASAYPGVTERFLTAADGTRLHAWHVPAPAGAPLVLYFGGNAEQVAWMIPEVLRIRTRAAWLLVDYRGYGASAGAPSEKALGSDALAWYDAVAKNEPRVFAFGRSLGSGVAVRVAAERRLDGVVLLAPFDSLVEVGKRHYPFLPVSLLLRHRFDSAALAPAIRAPLLCIASAQDEVVPIAHARRLFDAWSGPKRWLELGGGHNEIDSHADYWPRIEEFLAGR